MVKSYVAFGSSEQWRIGPSVIGDVMRSRPDIGIVVGELKLKSAL